MPVHSPSILHIVSDSLVSLYLLSLTNAMFFALVTEPRIVSG